jgi:hypothetical protein
MGPAAAGIPDVAEIVRLQAEAVERWHREPITHPHNSLLALVSRQHAFNFRLWHQEDLARSPSATDKVIADVKRSIDRLNQGRNDAVEAIDDELGHCLREAGASPPEDAPINTETPGSAIDRLSILALRRYHYREQLDRRDVDERHRRRVAERLALCAGQQEDLARSLGQLLDDLVAGRKRHKTYRQLKMYNDPTLNPAVYGTARE